jgi:hypothetical protein
MEVVTPLSIVQGTYPLPVPAVQSPRTAGSSGYPFDEQVVGGWFSVPNRSAETVRQAIQRYYRRHGKEKRFVQRIGPGGHPTVWRVK